MRNEPLKCTFLANYISAIRGCCTLKFLHELQIGQALLAHIRTGRGVPPKNFNPENIKFTLKFSVGALITSGLVGVSSQNFFQATCREARVIKWVQLLGDLPSKIWEGEKNVQNSERCLTTFDFDREYLRNASTYCK